MAVSSIVVNKTRLQDAAFLDNFFQKFNTLTPEEMLWWNVLTSGIREAIKERLRLPTVAVSTEQKKTTPITSRRFSEASRWLYSDSEEIGSVVWISNYLNFIYLAEVRNIIKNNSDEKLRKILKKIT